MKKVKNYIIENTLKIESIESESLFFPIIIRITCGRIEIGNWKSTREIDIFSKRFLNWKEYTLQKAKKKQVEQFESAFPNYSKILIGYIILKLKNTFKAFKKKFSKVS